MEKEGEKQEEIKPDFLTVSGNLRTDVVQRRRKRQRNTSKIQPLKKKSHKRHLKKRRKTSQMKLEEKQDHLKKKLEVSGFLNYLLEDNDKIVEEVTQEEVKEDDMEFYF